MLTDLYDYQPNLGKIRMPRTKRVGWHSEGGKGFEDMERWRPRGWDQDVVISGSGSHGIFFILSGLRLCLDASSGARNERKQTPYAAKHIQAQHPISKRRILRLRAR